MVRSARTKSPAVLELTTLFHFAARVIIVALRRDYENTYH